LNDSRSGGAGERAARTVAGILALRGTVCPGSSAGGVHSDSRRSGGGSGHRGVYWENFPRHLKVILDLIIHAQKAGELALAPLPFVMTFIIAGVGFPAFLFESFRSTGKTRRPFGFSLRDVEFSLLTDEAIDRRVEAVLRGLGASDMKRFLALMPLFYGWAWGGEILTLGPWPAWNGRPWPIRLGWRRHGRRLSGGGRTGKSPTIPPVALLGIGRILPLPNRSSGV
jgi:hypothetical protein